MKALNADKVILKGLDKTFGEYRTVVLESFAIADEDFPTVTIRIMYTKANVLRYSPAAAIEKFYDKLIFTLKKRYDPLGFRTTKHNEQAFRFLRSYGINFFNIDLPIEDFSIQKLDGIHGLILG